jgi:tubulin-specific chaperone A
MPAPSPLAIATQSVQRLVKEDSYYRKELAQQSERVAKLEADLKPLTESEDENAAFMLKQEVCHSSTSPLSTHFSFPLSLFLLL